MKKIYFSTLYILTVIAIFSQSTINITTSGGSWAAERWTNITTEADGGGTQVWGQGASIGDNAGDINEDIEIAAGTYYVNCYDTYGDGWNGGLISVTAYGQVIGDNGGVSPSNGAFGSGGPGSDDLEASFSIVVPEAPSCGIAQNVSSSDVTPGSITLNWDSDASANSWILEYGETGFTNTGAQMATASTNSYEITGLNSATSYDFYITTDCGASGTSSQAGPFTFSSAGTCGEYTFEYIGVSWASENSYTITNQNGVLLANQGYNAGTGDPVSVSIQTNIGDVLTLTLEDSYGDGWGSNVINVIKDGVVVGTYTLASGNGPESFNITACPSCTMPTALNATGVTSTTALLSWNAGDDETTWNIEWDTTGFNLGEGNNSSVNSTTYDLTGLTPATGYAFYVQSDCGSGETSEWAGPFTFGTQCEDISSFPYFQDFEDYLGCWNSIHNGDNTFWGWYTSNGVGDSAAVGLANASLHDDHLISPTFTVTDGVSDVFSVFANAFGAPEEFEILVSTSGIDTEDFTDTLLTGITLSTGEYEQTIVDLSDYEGQTINVSVHAYSDNVWYFLVDNAMIAAHSASTTEETACDSYEWNGETYEESGTYTFETSNSIGLDSIATLELTINNSFDSIANETACDSFDWNGETYTSTGNYDFASTTAAGCDSTITLALTINNSSGNNEELTACLTYDWYGTTYTSSGTYYAEGVNSAGCILYDTIVLTISSDATTTTETVCDSYDWNGTTYTTSTTETFSGACGDDVLNLTVNYSSSSSESLQACESYDWVDGNTYITSGTYTFVTENTAGCDSTMTLELEIGGPDEVDAELTVCDSLVWNGMTYYESGEYTDTLLNMYGCDSVVNVNLTVNSSSNEVVSVVECEADSYEWDGQTYTASGEYTNTYSAANGCDSVVTLSLTFNDPYAGAFVESLDDTRANFAAPTTLPACWEIDNTGLSTWTNSINGITVLRANNFPSGPSSGLNGEGNYLYVQTYNFDAGAYAAHQDSTIVNTTDLDLSSMTDPELNFYYQMNGDHMGHLSVWVNDDNGSTEIFNESGNQGEMWSEESISLGEYSGTISFSILSILDTTGTGLTALSEMAIDNFEVREAPSCYDPYSLSVDGIDGSEATVSWMTNESITSWNYVSGETGFDPLSASASTIDASTVTLTGLEYATQYEFYVQSDCGTDWVGPLVINVPYPADYGCPHTVNMVDDYGDGWNGGSIDVLVNGSIVIAGGTIDDGAELSVEFGAEDGDEITVNNFVPGSWVGEIGFNITDGSGAVIFEVAIGELTDDSEIDTTLAGFCPENDIAVLAGLVPSGCDLTSSENIEIWITNIGVASETGFTVSYAVNGGTPVSETVSGSVEPGDTLTHVFAAVADMTAAGDYEVELSCSLSSDINTSNDSLVVMGMNTISPSDPTTMGDTSCVGSTASLMASSEEYVVWYDAEGNVVGTGENLMAMDSVTSLYYAEAVVADGYNDDFESYSAGDFIAESNTEEWATWPGGTLGGQYDAPVSDDQAASGSNSLHLDNAEPNVPDPVMIFGGQTWNSGTFEFSMNMYVATSAYFNLQGSANIGTVWAMQVTFDDQGAYDFEGGALTGSYPGTGQWFNITLKCNDLTTSTWELFIDGESQGSATLPNGSSVGGCNFYAADGNDYYVDDVSWTAASADACRSGLVEVVSTVEECLGINGIVSETIEVYPNPNNGEFMVSNTSEIITITITDVQGKTVHSMNNLNIDKVNIDMTDLEKGMYLINIETGSGTVTKPVMVK